ncbi:MAG: IclR family transcriptional regulator C-terminal domain-containing protein, partial [Chloroflexota bacterium]
MNGPGGMVLDGNAVRSVDRAAALLLALGETQGEAGVTELARRVGLHKSTASRLLATLQKRGLVSYTERTIVELEPLLEELARIRRRGYATAIGEYELGLNAVSAPVHDARGNVIAAVDIWGPAFRLT